MGNTLNGDKSKKELTLVGFDLYRDFYGCYVQMNDDFETVHVWSEDLALRNKGRWTPVVISERKYKKEKEHSWNQNDFPYQDHG
jgi:hypothetical protein